MRAVPRDLARGNEIEQTPTLVHVHEDVHIASGSGFSTHDRPEDPNVAGTVPGRDLEDFVPSGPKLIEAHLRVPLRDSSAMTRSSHSWVHP
jgi:hypothetical protein